MGYFGFETKLDWRRYIEGKVDEHFSEHQMRVEVDNDQIKIFHFYKPGSIELHFTVCQVYGKITITGDYTPTNRHSPTSEPGCSAAWLYSTDPGDYMAGKFNLVEEFHPDEARDVIVELLRDYTESYPEENLSWGHDLNGIYEFVEDENVFDDGPAGYQDFLHMLDGQSTIADVWENYSTPMRVPDVTLHRFFIIQELFRRKYALYLDYLEKECTKQQPTQQNRRVPPRQDTKHVRNCFGEVVIPVF